MFVNFNQNIKKKKVYKNFVYKLVFKDVNQSYLQDEQNDDGSESSDEKINVGKIFLTQEIQNSAEKFAKNMEDHSKKKLLSRKIIFKKL